MAVIPIRGWAHPTFGPGPVGATGPLPGGAAASAFAQQRGWGHPTFGTGTTPGAAGLVSGGTGAATIGVRKGPVKSAAAPSTALTAADTAAAKASISALIQPLID